MTQRSIAPDVFRIDETGAVLLGGYSATSGQFHFPISEVCPYSGADDVVAVELSTVGTVWGHTAVTAAPPGYEGPVPYGFGVVELTTERLRVITRFTVADPTAMAYGDHVELCTDVVGVDPDGVEIVTWAFRPAASHDSTEDAR